MKTLNYLIALIFITLQFGFVKAQIYENPGLNLVTSLDDYNVIWNSPSENSHGSMPIGNGDIGANVWVEPSGELVLLLSKTDAWDEVGRLCKLGRIRIKLPSLENFRQELSLADGEIRITADDITTRVWIDANRPLIHIEMDGKKPFATSVKHETWRTKERVLKDGEERGAWGLIKGHFHNSDLVGVEPRVYPDTVLDDQNNQIVFFHRNPTSVWSNHMKAQRMDPFIRPENDPLRHRTFGCLVYGENLTNESKDQLVAAAPAKQFTISIAALTAQAPTTEVWVKQLKAIADKARQVPLSQARSEHQEWWHEFWKRSWVVTPPMKSGSPETIHKTMKLPERHVVSRAYTLQRWMNACAGRGGAPIKFNGSIFNVECIEPIRTYNGVVDFDADFREWGDPYWWQNTRLIYWTMIASGDFDLMKPMLKMYTDALPLRIYATKKYFKHDGAFYPEIIQFWGTPYGKRDYYEWDPENPDDKQMWWGIDRRKANMTNPIDYNTPPGWYWQSGIELIAIMLAYYDGTGDKIFLEEKLIPVAREVLTFYEQHWPRNKDGKLHFYPISSLEAIQNATNPMPDVAGLRFVLPKLIACSGDEKQKEAWLNMLADLPPLPIGGPAGEQRLLTAEKGKRHSNHENPEFYAVFPYELFGVGKPDLAIARNAWPHRTNTVNSGWSQNGIHAAMLGFTDEAKKIVLENFGKPASGFRFPGFYGPNYDWVPDQDHGSTTMIAVQKMLLQTSGDKILLLPAWPKEWDVSFKLHATKQTTVECHVKDGEVVELKVIPESRRKDVEICNPFGI